MRILIAEDDPVSRRILEKMLDKLGYETLSAADGVRAWEAIRSAAAPHILLLDWMMPGMDGIEVCRRVRQLEGGQNHYIIFITALGGKQDIVSGLDAGADDYLTKPFDRGELVARIRVGRRVVRLRAALEDRIAELQDALDHIKTLQGIIPICSYCHKIRSDTQSWDRLEKYFEQHSNATFSHGICPGCMEKHFPEPADPEGW